MKINVKLNQPSLLRFVVLLSVFIWFAHTLNEIKRNTMASSQCSCHGAQQELDGLKRMLTGPMEISKSE